MLPNFAYVRPTSLKEATGHLASPGARAASGGTDLIGCLRDGVFSAERVVSLAGVAEMRGVARTSEGGLRIGALTTIAAIASHPDVVAGYPCLAQAAAAVASPQLRNQGTIGGNLCQRPRCWYYRGDFHCARKGGDKCFAAEGENQYHCIFGGNVCYYVHPSDTAPALVAYGALLRLVGPGGSRVVPVEKFFVPPAQDFTRETVLEPGEIVTEVVLPPPLHGGSGRYRKVRARGAWDFALAGVAIVLATRERHVESAHLVLSGVAPVPWRVPSAEAVVTGHVIDAAIARRAGEAAARDAQPLAHNAYKVALVAGVVEETLLDLGS
jgi:xanthine dehydrogenase YagS FAD-binding subunit